MCTRVFLSKLGQPILFVLRTGGVHCTLHGFIKAQLFLKTSVDPETHTCSFFCPVLKNNPHSFT